MSFSRPIQWHHSHADPLWPDGAFKLFKAKQKRKPCFYKYLKHAEIFPRYFQFSGGAFSLLLPSPLLPIKVGSWKKLKIPAPARALTHKEEFSAHQDLFSFQFFLSCVGDYFGGELLLQKQYFVHTFFVLCYSSMFLFLIIMYNLEKSKGVRHRPGPE